MPYENATLTIALIAGGLQAVETWVTFRDRKQALEQFESSYLTSLNLEVPTREVTLLNEILPADVLALMVKRTENCMEKYKAVLADDTKYFPEDVDNATQAVKACVCRELRRIHELNGSLPQHGSLGAWWTQFRCGV